MTGILLFGAGKSATVLIEYLIQQAAKENWTVTVADADLELVKRKTGASPYAIPVAVDIKNETERENHIRSSDIVISLLPPSLHLLVAVSCLKHDKNLLTASYVDEGIREQETAVKQKGLLFLYEMGLDPGIDHMSAMKIIHDIRAAGGSITSFRSHCGGLVAPESDDNPWHYKISWNPRNIVMAGSSGAVYKENNRIVQKSYREVFENCSPVHVDGLEGLVAYPNRDSLQYLSLYELEEAATFERTTLRYTSFCEGWKLLVAAGLTEDTGPLPASVKTYKQWSEPLVSVMKEKEKDLFGFLGFFTEDPLPPTARSSADILQNLLEQKLLLKETDRDMIVMVHEFEYTLHSKKYRRTSQLVVKGKDFLHTAMARTVGLPLGIAAKLILRGSIRSSGLQIPVIPDIYEPVLNELAACDIYFKDSTEEI